VSPWFKLPPAATGAGCNRSLYFFEGQGLTVGGRSLTSSSVVELDAAQAGAYTRLLFSSTQAPFVTCTRPLFGLTSAHFLGNVGRFNRPKHLS